uniref:Esterase-like protein n=1 Tax=Amphichorda felina TaxID=37994 RepID=A0A2D2AP71_AMPFL|nr:esterase-like protein [Beauveria felina]
MDDNPLHIQFRPRAARFPSAAPLVLIHDAGGTIYSYLRLGDLKRDVWAISDPYFEAVKPWDGGFDEMAEHYQQLIENAGIRGPILLGGWSLGAYVSLAIAKRMLHMKPCRFYVTGILMVDSPIQIPTSTLPPCGPDPDFSDLPDLVRKSFDKFDDMLSVCGLPAWESSACQGKPVRLAAGGKTFTVDTDQVLHLPVDGGWTAASLTKSPQEGRMDVTNQFTGPPPAVLVRCLRRTPTNAPSQLPSQVDRHRDDLLLGWEGRHQSFIKAVIDVDKHHFNVFQPSNMDTMTRHMNEGLNILDNLQIA